MHVVVSAEGLTSVERAGFDPDLRPHAVPLGGAYRGCAVRVPPCVVGRAGPKARRNREEAGAMMQSLVLTVIGPD